jgi:hypothetical protein
MVKELSPTRIRVESEGRQSRILSASTSTRGNMKIIIMVKITDGKSNVWQYI